MDLEEACSPSCEVGFETHLSYKQELYEEGRRTDGQDEDLLPQGFVEPLREQIAHCGDKTLHVHKLVRESKNVWAWVAFKRQLICSTRSVVTVITCESTASRKSIKKKQTVQKWGTGIIAVA